MFFCALGGVGFVDQGGRTWPAVRDMQVEGIKVELPPQYRIKILSVSNPARPAPTTDWALDRSRTTPTTKDDIPADVHHPAGDSTHETNVEMMSDSPDDSSLDDAHVHHSHGGKRPLFGDREEGDVDVEDEEGEAEVEEAALRGHRQHAHRLAAEEEQDENSIEEEEFVPHYPTHSTPHDTTLDDDHHIITDEENAGNAHRRPEIEKLRAERESIGQERTRWEGNLRESRRMV